MNAAVWGQAARPLATASRLLASLVGYPPIRAWPCGCFAVRASRSPNPTASRRAHLAHLRRIYQRRVEGNAPYRHSHNPNSQPSSITIRRGGAAKTVIVAGVCEIISRHGGCDWFPGGAEAMPRRDEISIPVETLAGRVAGNAPHGDEAFSLVARAGNEARCLVPMSGGFISPAIPRRVGDNAPSLIHFPEMAEWIEARLAAWPEADDAALTNRFVRGYYGPAADAILRLLPFHDFDAARWGEAIAAAESNPRILRRVRCAMAPFVADEISREIAVADAVRFRISREPS